MLTNKQVSDHTIQVYFELDQPLLWAFGMAYIKRPVIGVNARITPSFQADTMLLPSLVNCKDTHLKL